MKKFPLSISTAQHRAAQLDGKRLLLAFHQNTSKKELAGTLKELKLQVEETSQKENRKYQINHTATRIWVKSADGGAISDYQLEAIEERLEGKLDWVAPVYTMDQNEAVDARFSPLPNVLLIEKSEKLKGRQDELIKKFKLRENEAKSKYLTKFRYLQLEDTTTANAYELKSMLLKTKDLIGTPRYETMPMIKPIAALTPNDTLWPDQWNLTQINAPNAWDLSTGTNTVVICILDEGCDLTHPDLNFSEDGINLGTMLPTGEPTGNHGTPCAGIAAASLNNSQGVAGIAGNCLIMPVAFDAWTDVEVANGINYATTNNASVISMSFGWNPWDPAIIDPEIQHAFDNDLVMCVATHNHSSSITYPATNPLVMAIGASDQSDEKAGFSNWGDITFNGVLTGVSVVAPGVLVPSTDRQGGDGYDGGDYMLDFDGTSAATPHVAGLAALIRSKYPTYTNLQVRHLIERTADKVGSVAYASMTGFANGARNEEMGYGRINAFAALNAADIIIRDWAGDTGIEPSAPPSNNWWSYSDIVVRIFDDNVFNPDNPSQSKNVERGQSNFIYIRVTNNGPAEATNVVVDFRITPYIGLEFSYPNDWTLEDGMHVKPTAVSASFASILPGDSVIAKFTISAAQTETLYGWQYVNPWHPCLLASVRSDNDYAYANSDLSFGNLVLRKNNIAQRNLTVIDVLADAPGRASFRFPFVAGNLMNRQQRMSIEIDRRKLPAAAQVFLLLDDNEAAFPQVDFDKTNQPKEEQQDTSNCSCKPTEDQLFFTERTRIQTKFGGCDTEMILEKGSRISFKACKDKQEVRSIKGGHLQFEKGIRRVKMEAHKMSVELDKLPGQLIPLAVLVELPANLSKGDQYSISVAQRNEEQQVVGGADAVAIIG